MLKDSLFRSQWLDLTDPYFNVCPDNLQGSKYQMKNKDGTVATTLFSYNLDPQVQLTL